MNLSIVIPYYNRPMFLENTLLSIYHMTCHAERFEIVIVDDHSDEEMKALHVVKKFGNKMNFKVVYRPEKKGTNAGVVRNIGAKHAESELILFQDSDPIHMTSIVNQVIPRFMYGWEMVIFPSCYSLSKDKQEIIYRHGCESPEAMLKIRRDTSCFARSIQRDGEDGWYVHSQFRAAGISTIFAMWKKNFLEMGGFDEDFYRYWGNEDSDFMNRLKLRGMDTFIMDDMLSFHQNHYDNEDKADVLSRSGGWMVNQKIWDEEKKDRKDWVANQGREWGVV